MKIYCDMDMVLCDFLKAAEKVLGEPFPSKDGMSKDEKKQIIHAKKDFWHTLPWMSDGRALWKYITKNPENQVMILSAYAEWDSNCRAGKRFWIKKNLKPAPARIYLVRREEKKDYVGGDSILIDDYIRNIKEWEGRGADGVHHINTGSTIAKLKKLGI